MITEVKITNFRNIKSLDLTLGNFNAICGKNMIGKTNIIEAIYWALTDEFLDGSKADDSVLPNTNKDCTTEVEIIIGNEGSNISHSVKKQYKRNYTTSRGSTEQYFSGNITTYFYDEIKVKKADLQSCLSSAFGFEKNKIWDCKIDPIIAISNPLCFLKIDYKDLREIVFKAIGDVDTAKISALDLFAPISDVLKKFDYDEGNSKKYLKSLIKQENSNIDLLRDKIAEQTNVQDMPSDEQTKICREIEELSAKKNELESESVISAKNKELEELKEKCINQFNKEKNAFEAKRNEQTRLYQQYNSALNIQRTHDNSVEEKRQIWSKLENETINLSQIIDSDTTSISKCKAKIEELTKRINENEGALVCPKCGTIISNEHVEILKSELESEKTSLNLYEFNKEGSEKDKANKQILVDKAYEDYNNEKKKPVPSLPAPVKEPDNSECKISPELAEMKAKYISMQSVSKEELIAEENKRKQKIDELTSRITYLMGLQGKHQLFLNAQESIEKYKSQMSVELSDKIANEQKVALVDKYFKMKLEAIQSRIKEVFGDVEFVMFEDNIKDDSWSPTCYPKIIGKDVAYQYGSSSEKIETGIYIIEKIKKAFGFPNVPIIFDECEKFDSEHLKESINSMTKSQVICAKVSDLYDVPTLVDLSK